MNGWPPSVLAVGALLISSPVLAQSTPLTHRAFVNVSGGLNVTTSGFTGVTHPVTFIEPATVNTTYKVKSAPGFDLGGGVRIWRNLAVGARVERFTKAGTGDVTAQLPHPFVLEHLRPLAGDATGLRRSDTVLDVLAAWLMPLSARAELTLSGGPSFFSTTQDLVADVAYSQSYPYDTATYTGPVTQRGSGSAIGFNVGGDLTYLLARHVGVGASLIFSRAEVRFPTGETETVVTAGGAHLTGGIRLRF
jgi:hypothetical protein